MKSCSIAECERAHHARGLCQRHYNNWYFHGDPLADPPARRRSRPASPPATRFWSKVDFSNPDGCWLWTGARRHTYGETWLDGTKQYAHRVAYMLVHGGMPQAMVLHRCDTPLCVRPGPPVRRNAG